MARSMHVQALPDLRAALELEAQHTACLLLRAQVSSVAAVDERAMSALSEIGCSCFCCCALC